MGTLISEDKRKKIKVNLNTGIYRNKVSEGIIIFKRKIFKIRRWRNGNYKKRNENNRKETIKRIIALRNKTKRKSKIKLGY